MEIRIKGRRQNAPGTFRPPGGSWVLQIATGCTQSCLGAMLLEVHALSTGDNNLISR